jgi:hypothetical protein
MMNEIVSLSPEHYFDTFANDCRCHCFGEEYVLESRPGEARGRCMGWHAGVRLVERVELRG